MKKAGVKKVDPTKDPKIRLIFEWLDGCVSAWLNSRIRELTTRVKEQQEEIESLEGWLDDEVEARLSLEHDLYKKSIEIRQLKWKLEESKWKLGELSSK